MMRWIPWIAIAISILSVAVSAHSMIVMRNLTLIEIKREDIRRGMIQTLPLTQNNQGGW